MGVFVDNRVYVALGLWSGLIVAGLLARLVRRRRLADDPGGRNRQLVLCAVWFGWTVFQYLVYNITFVQHQGRYLFPALIPIGLAFSLGWREVLRPNVSRLCASLLLLLAGLLTLVGLATGDWLMWPLVFSAGGALGLLICSWMPRRTDALLFSLPFVGLAILDVFSLFGFVVPALS